MKSRALLPCEDDIQKAVIDWCRLQHDESRQTFHIPNEAKRSVGGYGKQGRLGTRTGASDLFVPAQRGGYGGLFLELKAPGKKPRDTQRAFAADMTACGYRCEWADSVETALAILGNYLRGTLRRPDWVHYAAPAVSSRPAPLTKCAPMPTPRATRRMARDRVPLMRQR